MSDSKISSSEFMELLTLCQEIASNYPDGVVFIGGIAVYLHSINHSETMKLAESTHDADFYISLADMSDLRDAEELTANRRLSKHQLVKRGFEFDIYTERHSALIVPYDQVIAHSVTYDTLRVACLEHLLVLKLEAYRDRYASTKGQKDAKDIIRLGLVASMSKAGINTKLCLPYLREEHLRLLDRVARGPEFLALAKGNVKLAKNFRLKFTKTIDKILLK